VPFNTVGGTLSTFEQVSEAIAAAARSLHHPEDIDASLLAIANSARESLAGFDLVGISTVDRRRNVVTRAATDHRVYELDQLQYSQSEGPCVDALTNESHRVVAPAIRHEQRWPEYVPRAIMLGLRSEMAVQIRLDEEGTLGGLNLYSTVSDDIDPDAESLAEVFAMQAAVALGGARQVQQLNLALHNRKVIGQAIGIVMERYQLDETRAFDFLARISSTSNTKLYAVAQHLVDVGNQRPNQPDNTPSVTD
jgi:transcriptional regulator with GAF, ATPase, and Fis domain